MPDLVLRDATTAADLAQVRALCWAYRDHLIDHAPATRALVEHFYPEDGYRATLEALPGDHDAVLLAWHGDRAVGCAMSHPLEDGNCEIKRVYVAPAARGLGAGRALVSELVVRAEARGQARVLLDTLKTLESARALYHALGFRERGPYAPLPPLEADALRFYEKVLT